MRHRPERLAPGLLALFAARRVEMTRLAHVVTGSNAVAEDLVQDAFVRLRRHWDDVADPPPYLRQATVVTVGGQVVVLHTVGPDRRPLVLDTTARSWRYGAPLPGDLPELRAWSAIAVDTDVVLVAIDRAYAFTPPLPSGGRRSAG